ncbi:MAG TPA: glycosyltransferase, partial [Caulobacter sp.]|nr:glycosyltransferase [Caulobacter sp.]
MTQDLRSTDFLASPGIEPTPWFDGHDDRPHLVHVFPSFNIGGTQVRFAALAAALHARFRHTVVSLNGDYGGAALVSPCAPV